MADLKDLLLKYRKGRNGFDDLALEVSRLYAAGTLFPPLDDGEEVELHERLMNLTPQDVERALGGKLGTIPLTREEYQELLAVITEFMQEWLGS